MAGAQETGKDLIKGKKQSQASIFIDRVISIEIDSSYDLHSRCRYFHLA